MAHLMRHANNASLAQGLRPYMCFQETLSAGLKKAVRPINNTADEEREGT